MPIGGAMFSSALLRGSGSGSDTSYERSRIKVLFGDFKSVTFPPPYETLKGKLVLTIQDHRVRHEGIKIRLEGRLDVQTQTGKPQKLGRLLNIFDFCPNDCFVNCGDLLHGQKRLEFTIKLRKGQPWPAPFISSYGSLQYRLIALIRRNDCWEAFAKKSVDFDGYYNTNWIPEMPLVDTKEIEDSDIKSTLSLSRSAIVRGESLRATLDIQELTKGTEVNVEMTLQRKICYGVNIQVDTIWSENQQSHVDKTGGGVLQEWNVQVPANARATYSNKFVRLYSVAYFLKYEAKLIYEGKNTKDFKGEVEVIVGTNRDVLDTDCPTGSPFVTPVHSPTEDYNSRCGSVLSLASSPPSYSQLSSRSTSLASLATLPPHYNDL